MHSLIGLTRAAMPLFEKRGGGSVVTLSYSGSQRVFPNYNVMGVAKAALEATVRYPRRDVGPKGVCVNAVSAGPIKTSLPLASRVFEYPARVRRSSAPPAQCRDLRGCRGLRLPPEDAAKGITGEVLMVDSGITSLGCSGGSSDPP